MLQIGEKFYEDLTLEKVDQIIEDLQDAYRWVRSEGPKLFRVDPNRIALVGHSAGG